MPPPNLILPFKEKFRLHINIENGNCDLACRCNDYNNCISEKSHKIFHAMPSS